MNKIIFLFFLLFASSMMLHAQKSIRLINQKDKSPVSDAFVYNQNRSKTAISNMQGIVLLNDFRDKDSLYIQHASFQPLIVAVSSITKKNQAIEMKPNLVPLSQIVISANRWEQDRTEVPNQIVGITKNEIDFENPQTAADLLGETHEVFIQKSQMGGGSPMIRGFSANSLLIVVDGIRMNNAIFRSGNLQNVISIDPNTIGSAEVIYGPGSVMYGSDALGGVMDFHTMKVGLNADGFDFGSNYMARFSTANMERTFHIDASYGGKKWGGLTSVTYSGFSDLRMGNNGRESYERKEYQKYINGKDTTLINDNPNIQKESGYEQLNVLQKVRFRPNQNWDFNYSFQYSSTTNLPRYDRLIQYSGDELKYGAWYYGPQKWMQNNLTSTLKQETAFFSNVRLILGYQYFEESRHDRKYDKTNLRSRTEKVDLFTLNLDMDKRFSEKISLFYGIDGAYNNVRSEGIEKDILTGIEEITGARYPDSTNHYGSAALYASMKLKANEKLTIIGGIRYSYISMLSRFKEHSYYDFPFDEIKLNTGALNGSLGAAWQIGCGWQLNTNLSSGFRAPNLDDIGKIFDSEPGNVIVPNKDLKPEYAYNADMSISKIFGHSSEASLTVFYTHIEDIMVRRDFLFNGQDSIMYDGEMSKVQAIVNGGTGYIYGGSFSLKANITNGFSVKSFLTYQYGRDEDDLPIRHVSPLFGSTGIMYNYKKLTAELYANYNGEISYKNLAPSERDKTYMYATDDEGNPFAPAWATLNLKAEFQVVPDLTFSMGLENILDHRYRPYSSGIAAAGRNFIFSIRGSF